mgnify:CR=1 FL=1
MTPLGLRTLSRVSVVRDGVAEKIVDEYGSLQELMDDISEDPERLGDFGVNNPAILADSLYRMKAPNRGTHNAPVCAVVVAGGSGQRFGNPGGKQLVNVAGRPLMSWSIRAFDRSDKVGHIVVVCPAERRARCAAWPSTRLTMTRPSALPMPAIPVRIPPSRRARGAGGL